MMLYRNQQSFLTKSGQIKSMNKNPEVTLSVIFYYNDKQDKYFLEMEK